MMGFLKILAVAAGLMTGIILTPREEARAARLYFELKDGEAAAGEDFEVIIKGDAEEPVNVIKAAVNVGDGLSFKDSSDGNSMISLWLEKPRWDEERRQLTFTGIIPGGLEATGAPLVTMTLTALRAGETGIIFDGKETKVYKHGPEGELDGLILNSLTLTIIEESQREQVGKADNDSPESFRPLLGRDENFFGGDWFLAFTALDKGTGIEKYEVAEQRGRLVKNYRQLRWLATESPYRLKDQNLVSYVYVKAVDKAGNERVVYLEPQNNLTVDKKYLSWFIIIVMVIGIWLRKKNWRKSEGGG